MTKLLLQTRILDHKTNSSLPQVLQYEHHNSETYQQLIECRHQQFGSSIYETNTQKLYSRETVVDATLTTLYNSNELAYINEASVYKS